MRATRVGLYSISVRGLDIPTLLTWAASVNIPFVHLRGGPRGFDLARCEAATLRHWRRCVEETVPITGVTADIDLATLFASDYTARTAARDALMRLGNAAAALGAGWVRLLARTPLTTSAPGLMPRTAVPLLAELHHPDWLTPSPLATLEKLLHDHPDLRLLADTAQLTGALTPAQATQPALAWVLAHTDVLHLSDEGSGLEAPGHAVVADLAATQIAVGQPIEVAVEWTGLQRTPETALARYQSALAWWTNVYHRNPTRS